MKPPAVYTLTMSSFTHSLRFQLSLMYPSTPPSFHPCIHPTHQLPLVSVGPDREDVLDPAWRDCFLVVEVVHEVRLLLALLVPRAAPRNAQTLAQHFGAVAQDDLRVGRRLFNREGQAITRFWRITARLKSSTSALEVLTSGCWCVP